MISLYTKVILIQVFLLVDIITKCFIEKWHKFYLYKIYAIFFLQFLILNSKLLITFILRIQ